MIIQFDSWRFWESLAAGCLTFHFDFEKYGMTLPVMPENRVHYIGVDLNNIDETIGFIEQNPDRLAEIAANGRKWALEHYSPRPTAQRFLDAVAGLEK